MRGLTSLLWPIRYKPYPDELLSHWLVRLAHGHGLKVQTFCNLLFGNRLQVWNRDVDRLAPDWLVQELSARTGTPLQAVYQTTLLAYEGWFYSKQKASGSLQWIQTLKVYHRKREGFGLQFCPKCLREGPQPYFRKSWRVSFNTICTKHQCMLHDRCPNCAASVVFHRRDVGNQNSSHLDSTGVCSQCGFDLRRAKTLKITSYDRGASAWHTQLCRQLESPDGAEKTSDLDVMNVLRQLTMLLTTNYASVNLHAHVCDMLEIPEPVLEGGRVPFESRSQKERHHLIQLLSWLMVDFESRLRSAWKAKAVRYNHFTKDFEDAPDWYLSVVREFSDWRLG